MTDLRDAFRSLRRSPVFAAAVVAVLALGIGVNVAIFTAVDAVLFRPLPVREPGTLVRVYSTDDKGTDLWNSSYPVYADYRDGATSFQALAAFDDSESFHLSTGGKPERITGAVVTGNFFDVLGVSAQAGRLLTPGDDYTPGAHPVAVVSDRLWRSRFDRRADAVGATVRINGHPFTVVGVAPRGFTGVNLDSFPDVWVPTAMVDQALPEFATEKILVGRNLSWLDVVGRLKPGVTLARAQVELDVIARRRAASQPGDHRDPMARALPAAEFALGPDSRGEAHRISWMLGGMAALVLLIACADTAGLLLLRAERRRREIGVRLAIGASRRQIARQVLVESAFLGALAAAGGVLLALWASEALAAAVPPEFALPLPAALSALDHRALAFAIGVAVLSVGAFGILPALRAGRLDVVASLKGERGTDVPRAARLRDALVVGQLALTAVLLVGAGLMSRTLLREASVDPGFTAADRLEASVDLARQGYDRARGVVFFEEVLRRVSALPGVKSAALARTTPVQSAGMRTSIESDGTPPAAGETPQADLNIVTPGFFRTLGVPVVAGRDFDASDRADGPAVAIVNEAMAKKFWPGQNPIGRRIRNLGPPGVGGEVVGVVRDVRFRSLRRPADPTVYVPSAQFYMPRMTILLDVAGDAAAFRRPLERAVADLDPDMPLFRVRTLDEKLGQALGQGRLLALLVGAFGALALLLATAGLYGVVSYASQARTREFGIRLALGATPASVRRIVLSRGARLSLAGLAVGLSAAAAASRVAAQLLFGVSPLDPLSYAAAAVLLAAAALVASAMPARRASLVDPLESLRSE